MNEKKMFYFVKNVGQLQSPCEYALLQENYQVHFYKEKAIFYLTKSGVATDRIVMKISKCPQVQLVAERVYGSTEGEITTLRYLHACEGVDVEFTIEGETLVERVFVAEGSCTGKLMMEFEGLKEIVIADQETIKLEGLHEHYEFRCPCASDIFPKL